MSGGRPLHTLKIWGAGVNSPRSYGAEFVFFYVAAKATYIRLLHGKIGILEGFSALAPYTGVGPI